MMLDPLILARSTAARSWPENTHTQKLQIDLAITESESAGKDPAEDARNTMKGFYA